MQLGNLLLQGNDEQFHQERNFILGTTPVLAAEGEQGQVLNAVRNAGFGNDAHSLQPALVSGDPWQKAAFRPASITVHDNGDMARDGANGRYCDGRAVVHAGYQTAIRSASFATSALSISAM